MTIKLNFPKPSKVFNKLIYKQLYDYDTFTEVHYGGASSGKSHGVVQKVILKALGNWKQPRRILFLRKVAATVKDSIFEDVLACLSTFGIIDRCKVNMSDYRIILSYNATLIFKGVYKHEKIKVLIDLY